MVTASQAAGFFTGLRISFQNGAPFRLALPKSLANPSSAGYSRWNPGIPKVEKVDQKAPLARRQPLFAGFLVNATNPLPQEGYCSVCTRLKLLQNAEPC